jgi:hypothetical protein
LPVSRVVTLGEGGVGLTFFRGTKRAEIEFLNSDAMYIIMYDRVGDVFASEALRPENDLNDAVLRIRNYFMP